MASPAADSVGILWPTGLHSDSGFCDLLGCRARTRQNAIAPCESDVSRFSVSSLLCSRVLFGLRNIYVPAFSYVLDWLNPRIFDCSIVCSHKLPNVGTNNVFKGFDVAGSRVPCPQHDEPSFARASHLDTRCNEKTELG